MTRDSRRCPPNQGWRISSGTDSCRWWRTTFCRAQDWPRRPGWTRGSSWPCLLHDIAMAGLITSDHGYWGAQLIEPYVDEEVSWGVRYHQALRYFPDESVGYSYPEAYI